MPDHEADQARWKSESEFFDREAEAAMAAIRPTHPSTLRRYSELRRRRFNKEFRFRILGALEGKSVLDVGCGDGLNAMNFAMQGARVTGIDISAKAIELAKRRAAINGVSQLTNFICSPLETAQVAPGTFDVIWGDAVLHHVINDLDTVVERLVRWAKPGAWVVFGEPVNLNPMLRRFRLMLPIKTDSTPDERPLERKELNVVARHVPTLEFKFFSVFDRLNRFVLVNYDYEQSSTPRRVISSALSMLDYILLSIPALQSLAGSCVMYGRTSGPPTSKTPYSSSA